MAMYELSQSMDKEIERLQTKLKTLEPASKEYAAINQQLKTMYELRLGQYKEELELQEKASKSEAELAIREKELAAREREHLDEMAVKKKDRLHSWLHTGVDVVLTVAKVGGSVLCTALMLDQGYKFETEGRPVSSTFREVRNVISSVFIKKK